MKRLLLTIVLVSASTVWALAQSLGDYRSVATGNWNVLGTWERYNGTTWVTPSAIQGAPTSASGAITIRSGHTVTATTNISIDQTIIEAGGQVTVNGGKTLTIANGAGPDLTCSGTLYNSGTVTPTGTMVVNNGGVYNHAVNAGNVPTSTWNAGSTCLITGMTNNDPGGFGQSFYNYIWNCPGQAANMQEAPGLTTINGNFEILNTGTKSFVLVKNEIGVNLTVGGDFKISGGTFNASSGTGAPILTLRGNFEMTDGTVTETGTVSGLLRFAKAGIQTYTKTGGIISNTINFEVMSGSTTLLGTSIIYGSAGYFTLNSGGTLGIGSPTGIASSGASGNVQVAGTRTYSTGANFIYNGTAAQVTGTGLPATVNDLTVDNAAGATLTNSCTANGMLNLADGILTTGTNTVTVSGTGAASRTNGWVNGNLAKVILTGPQSKTFEVGTANGYSPIDVSLANVTTSGTLTCKAVQSVHPNVALPFNCLQRYWQLANSGIVFSTYSATLTYLTGDFNLGFIEAADEAAMVAGRYSPWSLPTVGARNPGGTGDGGSIQVTGLASFSDFTLAKDGSALDAALAVVLSQLSVQAVAGGVVLSWTTESEFENYQWLVERSESAAGPYGLRATIPGAGSSTSPRQYRWEDPQTVPGMSYYYRLGSMSLAGTVEYYGPVTVTAEALAGMAAGLDRAWPNPFAQSTQLGYRLAKAGRVTAAVYNLAGQKVRTLLDGYQRPGSHSVRWDGRDDRGRELAEGVYLIRLEAGDAAFTRKATLVR